MARPQSGIGRCGAHAEEAQHGCDQDGEAHADGGAHDDGRDAVGQDVQEQDAGSARADALQGVDEEGGLQAPRLGIDDAGEERPIGDGERQHGALQQGPISWASASARISCGTARKMSVTRMIASRHPALVVAGDEAERHAHGHGYADHHQRDRQGPARAQDHAREDVAPQVVGAEGVRPTRRLEAQQQVRGGHVSGIGRQQRRQHGHDGDEQHDAGAEHGRLVLGELGENEHGLSPAPAAAGRSGRAPRRPGC